MCEIMKLAQIEKQFQAANNREDFKGITITEKPFLHFKEKIRKTAKKKTKTKYKINAKHGTSGRFQYRIWFWMFLKQSIIRK